MTTLHPAEVSWRAGEIPHAPRFADSYYSADDPQGEVRHVFLAGNDLPERFTPGFRIGELGFGTGLNLAVTLAEWRAAGMAGRLSYTAFEAYPLAPGAMARALAPWPDLAATARPVLAALARGERRVDLPDLTLELITGDARETLPRWAGTVDAWFLDGFAPARNPEMWEAPLLAAAVRRMAPGGTLASYTAAGHVRRTLAAAGVTVARRPGFGRKRHMIAAQAAP